MRNRPVGAELFHADGQTDRQTVVTKVIVVCRNFANPSNVMLQKSVCLYANFEGPRVEW